MVRCIIGKRLHSRGDTRARPALNKRTDWIFNESSARYGDFDIARNSAALYRCITLHAGGNIDRTRKSVLDATIFYNEAIRERGEETRSMRRESISEIRCKETSEDSGDITRQCPGLRLPAQMEWKET